MPDVWDKVIACLMAASDAGTWAFWLENFNCVHPDHSIEEIDNPRQFAYANYLAAKSLYCAHKEKMDYWMKLVSKLDQIHRGYELFAAMQKAVEQETQQQFEEQFLNIEELTGYWEGDEYLALPTSNDVEFDSNSF